MRFALFLELLKDFKKKLATDETIVNQLNTLKAEVQEFAASFPMPGLELQ